MTADTIACIEALVNGPVDLVGWSDGGVITMHLALARPDLVRKVVVIGSSRTDMLHINHSASRVHLERSSVLSPTTDPRSSSLDDQLSRLLNRSVH